MQAASIFASIERMLPGLSTCINHISELQCRLVSSKPDAARLLSIHLVTLHLELQSEVAVTHVQLAAQVQPRGG
jgi:hypothetical protein